MNEIKVSGERPALQNFKIKLPPTTPREEAALKNGTEAAEAAARKLEEAVPRLEAREVSFYYGKFQALRNINLKVVDRQILALIGPSGSGKSTFLRLMNRMSDLVSGSYATGELNLEGENILGPEVDVVNLRKRVGMLFQRANPFPKSIYDNVAYGPRQQGFKNRAGLDAIVERCLKQAALWDEVKDKLSHSALALSGGQQQRLCLARTLAVEPEVILMDEPTSALDPMSTLKIEQLMTELRQKYTLVVVTHNMQQAARVSDYTAVFMMAPDRAGELVELGPTNQIFTNPREDITERYISGQVG